jgi:glycosyltransferase involved in cell wall biosynthesis
MDMDLSQRGLLERMKHDWLDRRLALPIVGRHGWTVTVSEYNRGRLAEEVSLDPEVIHHGIDQDAYRYRSGEFDRSKYGINEDARVILCVGRFYPSKGVRTLVDAYPRIRETSPQETELVLVGGGLQEEQIQSQISEVGQGDLHVLKDLPDRVLTDLYADADVFVLPSTSESFGIVFLEAMAAGLPVVYAEAGASPEVVGEHGIAVHPNDPDSIAEAVVSLLSDPERHRKYGTASTERAAEFSWRRAAEQYARVYGKVV